MRTAFVILSLRRGGWKYPALLAITVQLTGSVNASTLTFALLAPAIWIPYAVLLTREVDWRRAFGTILRSTVLIVFTSLWWAWALVVESGYGRDVLRFTEQPVTTSATLTRPGPTISMRPSCTTAGAPAASDGGVSARAADIAV